MNDAAIAIPNLLYIYAEHIDAGDFRGAARLFRHGALIAQGHRIEGEDAIVAMWEGWVRLYADGTPRTRHIITNPIIELDESGETARCRSQWTVLQATEGFPLQVIASGRYFDRFGRIDGAWQYLERLYGQIDLTGDMSAHLAKQLTRKDK